MMTIFSCLSITSEKRYFPILLRQPGGAVDWICAVPRNARMWKSIERNFDITLNFILSGHSVIKRYQIVAFA